MVEWMDFPIPHEFWWCTDILSSIFLQGVDQEILPSGQGRIDSVKINPSLLMMRECCVLLHMGQRLRFFPLLYWIKLCLQPGVELGGRCDIAGGMLRGSCGASAAQADTPEHQCDQHVTFCLWQSFLFEPFPHLVKICNQRDNLSYGLRQYLENRPVGFEQCFLFLVSNS